MSLLTTPFTQEKKSTPWQRLVGTHRLLALSVFVYGLLFAATIVLSIVDSRLITGAPAWFKPMKFAISSALYSATLLWMLSYVEGRPRWVKIVGAITVLGFTVELVAIFFQAARGVRSHFNMTTPLDGTLFSLMGLFVIVIWIGNMITAVLLLRQRFGDPTFAWGVRLGLLVTAVGAALGFLMTRPTPAQVEQIAAGEVPTFIGAHSVGVEDGGPGLPFTGWSTEGGDLRPAHFVGLHALQIIPLLGIVLSRNGRFLSRRRRTTLVWIGGLAYLGLTLLLTWQALRGQPLIAPDGVTLAALGGLVGAAVIATGVTVIGER